MHARSQNLDILYPNKSIGLENWNIVNDDVMGGISTSYLSLNDNKNLIFSGNLSLANNGGFASSRMRLSDQELNNIKAVKIKFKGDGNTYKLRFRQYNMRASYSSNFRSKKNKWTEVILPIKDFVATWRGYSYSNYPEIEIDKVYSLGLQISDKQEGEFELEIEYIKGIY